MHGLGFRIFGFRVEDLRLKARASRFRAVLFQMLSSTIVIFLKTMVL